MFEYFIIAFVEKYPIFMSGITIAGLAGVIKIIRTNSTQQSRKDRSIILGAGLVALFVGLLVFPINSFKMLEAVNAEDAQVSFVMGGFYISFVPMFYGLFWFLISLAGWLYYKRKTTAD